MAAPSTDRAALERARAARWAEHEQVRERQRRELEKVCALCSNVERYCFHLICVQVEALLKKRRAEDRPPEVLPPTLARRSDLPIHDDL